MASIISAPADLVIASVEGIPVRFAGITMQPIIPGSNAPGHRQGGIKVSLAGARGEETIKRGIQRAQAMEGWYEILKTQGKETAGHPPPMPAAPVFEQITTQISDELGTEYKQVGGQVAGDGTEWDAIWTYQPEPPEDAHELTIQFTSEGTDASTECRISLR